MGKRMLIRKKSKMEDKILGLKHLRNDLERDIDLLPWYDKMSRKMEVAQLNAKISSMERELTGLSYKIVMKGDNNITNEI